MIKEQNIKLKKYLIGNNLSNENVIHIYEEDFEYLQFRKLIKYSDKIRHAYTIKPLDFGNNASMKIKKEEVLTNYEKICSSLEIDKNNIYRPNQTHTNCVKKVEEEKPGIYTKEFQDVDGLITDRKEKTLSLSFADCTALYLYDPIKNIIGNIHSGWQGTYKEIIREAIKIMKIEYNSDPNNIICCIGPYIQKCCFEVDEDVKNMFFEKFNHMKEINNIIKKSENKSRYYIDTGLINKTILEQEGIKSENIIDSNICTKCNSNKLHSYRVEKEKSGRNNSIICLI